MKILADISLDFSDFYQTGDSRKRIHVIDISKE
jgi:hypothetical protein